MKNRLFRLLLVALLLATTSRAAGTNSEANIARVIAEMLERSHFAAHRHDGDLSEKFLDHYLDILDGTHMHFTEADIAEFAHYRKIGRAHV